MKACVLLSHFRAKAEMRRNAQIRGRPAVIVDRSRGRPLVVDSSAEASPVTAGMTLEEAMSHYANTIVLESDEAYYSRLFEKVLKSLQGVSDRVEKSELGVAYLDLSGLEAMYGGEARLVCALLNSVSPDLNPRVGLAQSKFAAYVAARTSRAGGVSQALSDVADFLAPFSINMLPVSLGSRLRLQHFGMHRMGDVASLKVEFLVDQFGYEGKRIWELCNGIDDSPIVPLKYEESVVEYTSLPFYSTSLEILQIAVELLLKRAYARPSMRNIYAAQVSLECTAFNSPSWKKMVNFKQGIGSPERASFILRGQVEADPPQAPIEDLTLTLSEFTSETGSQIALLGDVHKDRKQELVEIDQRLRTKLNGSSALHKAVGVAPWHPLPEMRVLQVPIDPTAREEVKPLYLPTLISVKEGHKGRPVEICDGKSWHRVVRIEDLWVLDLWWLPEPVARTYFHILRDDGRQTTLFQDRIVGCWYQQRY